MIRRIDLTLAGPSDTARFRYLQYLPVVADLEGSIARLFHPALVYMCIFKFLFPVKLLCPFANTRINLPANIHLRCA